MDNDLAKSYKLDFRSRLTIFIALFVALIFLTSILTYRLATLADFHFERARLAQQVYADYLRLSSDTQAFFRVLIDITTNNTNTSKTSLQLEQSIDQTIGLLRKDIAEEIIFSQPKKFTKLAVLAQIERQIEGIRSEVRHIHASHSSHKGTELSALEIDLIERMKKLIDTQLMPLIDTAIKEERLESTNAYEEANATFTRYANIAKLTTGSGMVLALAGLITLQRQLRRPLNDLSAGTQALAEGQLDYRLRVRGNDEFAHIAARFNSMANQLEKNRFELEGMHDNLQEQVELQTSQIKKANETRRQLLADISHELRTPLTVIRGEAQVNLRGSDKKTYEYKEALYRIVDQSQHLARLVDDLLLIARADAGVVKQESKLVSPGALLMEVCDNMRVLAKARSIDIKLQLGDINEVVIGDCGRLQQLFMILLDNAVHYSNEYGTVTVTLCCQKEDIIIEIVDSGIGIPEEEQELIFERFYRGTNAEDQYRAGTGLGLPVAHAITKVHGGDISLCSTVGEGSCFIVRLPKPGKPAIKLLNEIAVKNQ